MAEKDKYIIKVEGKLVEVTPEVYYAHFRMERQERRQEEKKQRKLPYTQHSEGYSVLSTIVNVLYRVTQDKILPVCVTR